MEEKLETDGAPLSGGGASPAEESATIEEIDRQLEEIERQKSLVTVKGGAIKPKEKPPDLSIIRADELAKMSLERPFFIVEDVLPVGLTLVASPPKYGKSWLMLDLCTAAALGAPFLGHSTNKCNTLYLALEDSEARLRDRLLKVLRGRAAPPAGCAITTHALDVEHGLLQQLTDELDKDPELKLIVIDTFQKVRAGSKKNETDYAADYREVGAIKDIADKYKVAIILVTHVRKMKDPSDPFSNISGTSGLTGAADTMIVLNKESRTDENTVLSVTGRDVEMNEWYITFDKSAYRWKIRGTYDDIMREQAMDAYYSDPIVITIKKLLEENPEGWTGRASDIIDESRRFRVHINTTSRSLGKEISKLQYLLYDNDNIQWDTIKNGKGAVRHHFQYGYNPFEDEPQGSDAGEAEESQETE